jgi:transmembrane sensor
MNDQRFKVLAAKYTAGLATAEEQQELNECYELLQSRYQDWDKDAMGDEDIFKEELYKVVELKIDRVERLKFFKYLTKIAAILVLILGSGLVFWQERYPLLNYIDPVHQLTVTTKTEMKQIRFADGTRIWLNSGSKLTYPEKFRTGNREVTLQGEAFFDVTHNKEQPFLVHAGTVTTHVLGTSFNIKAYQNDNEIAVTVLTGKVGVVAQGAEKSDKGKVTLLTPDQRAIFIKNNNNLLKQDHINAFDESAWKDGKLLFNKIPLAEVCLQLERKFRVKITYPRELASSPVTADLSNETINEIVNVLAGLFKATANATKNGYSINKK